MRRDGCKVPFKPERIQEATLHAAKTAGVDNVDYYTTIVEVISRQMQGRAQVDINKIQIVIGDQLISGPYRQLVHAYIEYRYGRDSQHRKHDRPNQKTHDLVE